MQAGATVPWTNKTDAPHTVTSDSGVFNTNQFTEDHSVTVTFSHAGTFAYHCMIHPYMHGTVVVQAATSAGGASTPPAVSPSTGGGGTAHTVVGLPRTGGAAGDSRENTLFELVLGAILGLVLLLYGLGVRRWGREPRS